MVSLMQSYPRLQNLPALQSLKTIAQNPSILTPCCGAKADVTPYRLAFENGMRALSDGQKKQMKEILGATEVTYFAKVQNRVEQRTF